MAAPDPKRPITETLTSTSSESAPAAPALVSAVGCAGPWGTTNDLVASAIVTLIDRRPSDRRPFAVTDFARRIFGDEHKRVSAKLTGVQLAYRTATAADREFVRGKANPLTNLSNQLARRAVAEAVSDVEEDV